MNSQEKTTQSYVSNPAASPARNRKPRRALLLLAAITIIAFFAFILFQNRRGVIKLARYAPTAARGVLPTGIKRVAPRDAIAEKIVRASHAQIGTSYDPAYQAISYPGGDVDNSKGACTDVVVRALRSAGCDLQKLLHEDMTKNFGLYPQKWGLSKPDKNIDHRRVPNQMKFFSRFGISLPTRVGESTLKSWQPGDIVFWDMQNGQLHTGIVSDGVSSAGVPLVIHNGWICVEDDSLSRWKIIGHFRYPKRYSERRT
jgi:uncharacterized protein YijF (DUF1287 family)